MVLLYHAKYLYRVTDGGLSGFIKLFKQALPKENGLPSSFEKMKAMIKKLGISYNNIDACSNGCVRFWKENIYLDSFSHYVHL